MKVDVGAVSRRHRLAGWRVAGLLLITALTATTLLGRRHPPDDDSTQDLVAVAGPESPADAVGAGR